jgi:integrase
MARSINKLSARGIAAATKPGLYGDGNGLWLQVGPNGNKAWCFRYMLAGKARQMGMGAIADYTLAEARDRVRSARQKVRDGIDPIEQKKAERAVLRADDAKAVTFAEAAARYIKAHEAGWKSDKHGAQWGASLETYAYPTIGKLPVGKVETAHVLKIIEPIWTTKTETANRVRGRIESVLDWAKARHLRDGENPARWKGHIDSLLPAREKITKVKHHEALPFVDMQGFMAKLRAMTSISARALEFTILTAARTGEAIGAVESEVDLANGVWTIPGERMKSGKEHRVPLPARALEIIATTPREKGSAFLFSGARKGKGLSNMAMLECLRGIEGCDNLTVHGFRSTFRDWAGDMTNFQTDVIEAALAHQLKDKVEAAYRRGNALEKRRRLMDAWAGYCAQAQRTTSDNVTAMRAAS